jgi:hypothetical protein
MKKLLACLLFCLFAFQSVSYAIREPDQTIVGMETEGYFYADGKMKKGEGVFENTYVMSGDTITRTRVYDTKKKQVFPDSTVYHIQGGLDSDPGRSDYGTPKVIRAIGRPGTDAIEVLVIGDNFIQSCKSTGDYFVISRFKRVK